MTQAKIYKYVGLSAGVMALGVLVYFSVTLAFLILGVIALIVFFYFYTQAAFYILVAYLPFQLALNLSPDVDLLSGRVLILLLAAVWLLKALKEKRFSWPKDRPSWALTLFFLLALISVLVAQNQTWSGRKLLVFLSVFPLFFLTKFLIRDFRQTQNVFWIVIGTALASALIALAQFGLQFVLGTDAVFNFWAQNIVPPFLGNSFGQAVLQNPSWFVEIGGRTIMRAIGLFPDPHMLAFFLGMTLPLVLAMLFGTKSRKKLLFCIFCVLLAALALTFSRGGYVGVATSFLVMLVLGWRRLGVGAKAFVSSVFFILAIAVLLTPVYGRLFSSFDLSEGSNSGRLAIWAQSLAQVKNNPILGVGLGNYPLSINFAQDYRSAVTSHNLFLDILVETGIFGLLSWLWFLGGTAKRFLDTARQNTGFIWAAAVGLLGSFVYFAAHSFFETAIFNPTILALLMLLAGLSGAFEETKK